MSDIIQLAKTRDPNEPEFHQAVTEVMDSIEPVLEKTRNIEKTK